MCGRGRSSRGRRPRLPGAQVPPATVLQMALAISGLPPAIFPSPGKPGITAVAYGIVCQDGGSLMKQKRIARIAFDGIY